MIYVPKCQPRICVQQKPCFFFPTSIFRRQAVPVAEEGLLSSDLGRGVYDHLVTLSFEPSTPEFVGVRRPPHPSGTYFRPWGSNPGLSGGWSPITQEGTISIQMETEN